MTEYVGAIEKLALKNTYFRQVLRFEQRDQDLEDGTLEAVHDLLSAEPPRRNAAQDKGGGGGGERSHVFAERNIP